MYRADGHSLYHPDGRLILGGPATEIAAFAAALSAAMPATDRLLRAALLDLIEATSDCSFAPYIPLSEGEAAELEQVRRDSGRRAQEADALFAQGRLAL
ncbi:MAG: hypothetical protein RLY86_675 [Pseudomonadota bacterium]|jgi:hypothetical protein